MISLMNLISVVDREFYAFKQMKDWEIHILVYFYKWSILATWKQQRSYWICVSQSDHLNYYNVFSRFDVKCFIFITIKFHWQNTCRDSDRTFIQNSYPSLKNPIKSNCIFEGVRSSWILQLTLILIKKRLIRLQCCNK